MRSREDIAGVGGRRGRGKDVNIVLIDEILKKYINKLQKEKKSTTSGQQHVHGLSCYVHTYFSQWSDFIHGVINIILILGEG